MATLLLKHVGGETREVEVLFAYRHSLAVKWGDLAGHYYLDVRTNRLGRAPTWSAVSIDEAKTVWLKLSVKPDRYTTGKEKVAPETTKAIGVAQAGKSGWTFSRGKTG